MMYLTLQDLQTALMKASAKGHTKCISILLNNHANVDLQDWVSASGWYVLNGRMCKAHVGHMSLYHYYESVHYLEVRHVLLRVHGCCWIYSAQIDLIVIKAHHNMQFRCYA